MIPFPVEHSNFTYNFSNYPTFQPILFSLDVWKINMDSTVQCILIFVTCLIQIVLIDSRRKQMLITYLPSNLGCASLQKIQDWFLKSQKSTCISLLKRLPKITPIWCIKQTEESTLYKESWLSDLSGLRFICLIKTCKMRFLILECNLAFS